MAELDSTPWVERLVTMLKEHNIRTPEVEEAFRRVPRHRFVETFYRFDQEVQCQVRVQHNPDRPQPEHLDIIYGGGVLITRVAADYNATSSTSEVALMAEMLERLTLGRGHRVSEIGAGTGYNAALMAELVGDSGRVVTVDIQEDVVAQTRRLLDAAGYGRVKVLARDGFLGAPEDAPFDRIVATVGCTDLSPHWVEQLHPDGFMLIPLLHGGFHPQVKVWQTGRRLLGKILGMSGFMPIQGEMRTDGPWPPANMAAAMLQWADEVRPWYDELAKEHLIPFYYYLAMRSDQRSFNPWSPTPVGLYDAKRGAVAYHRQSGKVLLKGDAALYHELGALYEEWKVLGRPQMGDYAIEFIPRTEPAPPLPARAWTLERKYYRQVWTLPQTTSG